MTRLTAVPMAKDRTPLEISSMLRPLFDICGRDGKVYNEGDMSFDDKEKAPDDKALAKGLGPSKKLWDEFVLHVAADFAPVTEAWGFYKSWSLRLKQKKRTIVYLLPRDGHFLCAFVYGGKATEAARQAKLPKAVMTEIEDAPVYAEGRGFRLEVRTAKDLETMKTLAAIKMAKGIDHP
jgi:hypothetical protein